MEHKKIYDCPEILMTFMEKMDVLSASGDPSRADEEWAAVGQAGGAKV
jgi:hypothetical protein